MLPPQLSTSKISPMTSQQIAAIAARNTEKARRIIRDTGIIDIWESAGAEINLVGSLSTGLFMKHRDIDFHILMVFASFLRVNRSIKFISFDDGEHAGHDFST